MDNIKPVTKEQILKVFSQKPDLPERFLCKNSYLSIFYSREFEVYAMFANRTHLFFRVKRNLKKFSSDSTGLGWKYRIDFTKYVSGIELKTIFEIKLVPKT